MKKKAILSRMYVIAISLVFILSLSSIAYGAVDLYGQFDFYSQHANYFGYSDVQYKYDDSSALVSYEVGPSSNSQLYVKILASTNENGVYTNYTLRHIENGVYVEHYHVKLGNQLLVPNLVYESNNCSMYTKLQLFITSTGTVQGRWSPSTYEQ